VEEATNETTVEGMHARAAVHVLFREVENKWTTRCHPCPQDHGWSGGPKDARARVPQVLASLARFSMAYLLHHSIVSPIKEVQ